MSTIFIQIYLYIDGLNQKTNYEKTNFFISYCIYI